MVSMGLFRAGLRFSVARATPCMRTRASIGHARMMHASASTRASNKLVTAYSFAAKPPPESAAQQGKEEGKDAKDKAPAGDGESKDCLLYTCDAADE